MSADSAQGSGRQLAASGGLLGGAMIVANIGNYVLNLLLGRWLTPAQFSDATLMVTLMLTATSLALCLQLVAARYIGMFDAAGKPGKSDRLAKSLTKIAVVAGIVLAGVLAAGSSFWSSLFQTESWVPFVVLGLGMPFYLAQSVGRGVMQGRLHFRGLAATFVLEMIVRLGFGAGLVVAGFGVTGATIGLTLSFVGTWLAVRILQGREGILDRVSAGEHREVRLYAASVSILLVGQIIANNSDVFVAKASLAPDEAGVYSAIALVGRAVFFLAWSVATVIFPVAARRHQTGADSGLLLKGGMLAVALIGAGCAVGGWFLGGPILGVVLGAAYADISAPLAAYAAATTLFAIANLSASHSLSKGRTRESWILVGGSILQVVLLLIWNGSIWELIAVQCIAMSVLLIALILHHVSARQERPATMSGVVTP